MGRWMTVAALLSACASGEPYCDELDTGLPGYQAWCGDGCVPTCGDETVRLECDGRGCYPVDSMGFSPLAYDRCDESGALLECEDEGREVRCVCDERLEPTE